MVPAESPAFHALPVVFRAAFWRLVAKRWPRPRGTRHIRVRTGRDNADRTSFTHHPQRLKEHTMNPNATLIDSDLKRLARKRVKARLGWLIHATVYVCVITGLTLLGLSQGKAWPIYPALGWGFGLFMHGVGVFFAGAGGAFREQWVEREHQRLVRQRTDGAS